MVSLLDTYKTIDAFLSLIQLLNLLNIRSVDAVYELDDNRQAFYNRWKGKHDGERTVR
jgi:hypothetical protein